MSDMGKNYLSMEVDDVKEKPVVQDFRERVKDDCGINLHNLKKKLRPKEYIA